MNAQWRAVMARDAGADGRFVYAVRSTGVYCRPSCPSKRPRRDRVVFFRSPLEAERRGYRACKRCRPGSRSLDPWIDKIRRACAVLEASASGERTSLAELAARIGGSPYHLQRNFTRLVGISPRAYVDACRLRTIKQRLREGDRVTDAVFNAGYGSSSRFYERAATKLGMRPSTYRRGGLGMAIRYTIVDSTLGRLLVAATPQGVCAVALGDSDTELRRALEREYPRAALTSDEQPMARWTREIVSRLQGQPPRIELPLDVRATAFQWRVWQALAAIPFGETRSYADVADAIGQPRAVRAVARACGANPVAVALPCHRVVGSSGALTGYRWGLERKRELLRRERTR